MLLESRSFNDSYPSVFCLGEARPPFKVAWAPNVERKRWPDPINLLLNCIRFLGAVRSQHSIAALPHNSDMVTVRPAELCKSAERQNDRECLTVIASRGSRYSPLHGGAPDARA